jgi:hypothetical protein
MEHAIRSGRRFAALSIIVMVVFMLSAGVSADDFVSLKGKFKITYPKNWSQVDYATADMRIGQAGGDLGYEAAFTCTDDPVVLDGRYIILTVDTAGELSARQIDSALNGVATDFGRSLRETSSDLFLINPPEDAVSYCPQLKAAAVFNHLDAGTPTSRMNVVLRKFYDRGTADFYFYAPDTLITPGLADLRAVLSSFTTEDLTVTEGQPPSVGDIEKGETSSSTMPKMIILVIVGALLLASIVIWLIRRRGALK